MCRHRLLDGQARVALEGHLGIDLEYRGVLEILTLVGGLGLYPGPAGGPQVLLGNRLEVARLHHFAQYFLAYLPAVALANDFHGHLTRAKTLEFRGLAIALEAAVNFFFDALGRYLHLHAALETAYRLNRNHHPDMSSFMILNDEAPLHSAAPARPIPARRILVRKERLELSRGINPTGT